MTGRTPKPDELEDATCSPRPVLASTSNREPEPESEPGPERWPRSQIATGPGVSLAPIITLI